MTKHDMRKRRHMVRSGGISWINMVSRRLRCLLLVLLLLGSVSVAQEPLASDEFAFVLTTDYWSAGYYSTIELMPPRETTIDISPVHYDAIGHYDEGEDMVFVVNRYLADNIQLVDPNSDFATVGQYSVGNGSNPHDIRLADSGKAYVSRFERTNLIIVDPYTGDSLGFVDLAPVADSDGIPEMDRMEIVNGYLFVTLNCLDHVTWQPNGPGKVAVVDIVSDTLVDCDTETAGVQPIVLQYGNPYSELRYSPDRGELIVGCLGRWSSLDGGVETIDPFTLTSNGVLISEEQLGGDVSDALVAPNGSGYAVVMDKEAWPDNYARVVAFDPETGSVIDTLFQQTSGMGASVAGIEANTLGELYVCDRDAAAPGIRVYETSTVTLAAFIDVGLPPYDVVFVQEPYTPADTDQTLLKHFNLLPNYPNPFNPHTQIPFLLTEPASVNLRIYDPSGRVVRTLVGLQPLGRGLYTAAWDGRDDNGRELASGVYFCRLEVDQVSRSGRLVLLR